MEYTELKNTVSLMALISLTNPLELIKTRLQTTKELVSAGKLRENYKGVIDCLKKVFKNEGLKCFWKGNAITLFRFYPN